jgi:hypothetical protein
VVLEVSGPGIEEFLPSGGTKVIWSPTTEVDTYRVIAINEVAGDIQFQVSVLDLAADKPSALVISLADGNNMPIPVTGGYEVAFTH